MAALLVGAACSSSILRPADPRADGLDFFPLEAGTEWVYRVRRPAGGESMQRVRVVGLRYLDSRRIVGTLVEERGGAGEPVLDPSWQPIAYYRRGPFLYRLQGLAWDERRLHDGGLDWGDEIVLPDAPAGEDRWESEFAAFDVADGSGYGMRLVARATSTEASVTVPAGRFDGCLLVDTTIAPLTAGPSGSSARGSFRYRDWYAAGVGLVKSVVSWQPSGAAVSTIELVAFREGAAR